MLIQLFMQFIYFFTFYKALYDKKKIGCHALNDLENLTIDQGVIMEKCGMFNILYFLWEPCMDALLWLKPHCSKFRITIANFLFGQSFRTDRPEQTV